MADGALIERFYCASFLAQWQARKCDARFTRFTRQEGPLLSEPTGDLLKSILLQRFYNHALYGQRIKFSLLFVEHLAGGTEQNGVRQRSIPILVKCVDQLVFVAVTEKQ